MFNACGRARLEALGRSLVARSLEVAIMVRKEGLCSAVIWQRGLRMDEVAMNYACQTNVNCELLLGVSGCFNLSCATQ